MSPIWKTARPHHCQPGLLANKADVLCCKVMKNFQGGGISTTTIAFCLARMFCSILHINCLDPIHKQTLYKYMMSYLKNKLTILFCKVQVRSESTYGRTSLTNLLKIEWIDPCWLRYLIQHCIDACCEICKICNIWKICRILRICKKCRICKIRKTGQSSQRLGP